MKQEADVCMILEGTYPYVQGGVSSWVHQILSQLPDLTFAIVYLGSTKEAAAVRKYQVPANVVSVTEVFLFEPLSDKDRSPSRISMAIKAEVYRKVEAFYLAESEEDRRKALWHVLDLVTASGITFSDLCKSREIWDLLLKVYERFCPEESFMDFFWTSRFIHMPIWAVIQSIEQLPSARLYHSVSTGYAGLAGAMVSRKWNVPYLITEHGIYTKERIAEISQADWIYDSTSKYLSLSEGLGKIKQIWINLFMFLGNVSYDAATRLVSLYEGITQLQIEFGATPERMQVIPNGIDPSKFDDAMNRRRERLNQPRPQKTVGFIGRVVPIKDVKTLLRAASIVVQKCPEAVFEIIGPTDEDPGYFAECEEMMRLLGLENSVHFVGSKNIREILDTLDVVLLTSISEGLPLIILEAFSAGIPVVSTDVGACRELIFGRTAEDKAIGNAGFLTKICSPEETADALLRILQSPDALLRMGEAGRLRTERYYRQDDIMDIYHEMYLRLAGLRTERMELQEA